VGAEGAERVGEAARGGVEGDELREEDRVRVRARASRDEDAGVELRGVSGVLEARAAQRGEEGRQLAEAAAASRAHAGSAASGVQRRAALLLECWFPVIGAGLPVHRGGLRLLEAWAFCERNALFYFGKKSI